MSNEKKETPQEAWVAQLSNLKLQIAAILHSAESQSSALQFLRALGDEITAQWKALGGEKWGVSPVKCGTLIEDDEEEVPGLTRVGVDVIAAVQAGDYNEAELDEDIITPRDLAESAPPEPEDAAGH